MTGDEDYEHPFRLTKKEAKVFLVLASLFALCQFIIAAGMVWGLLL